MFETVVFYTVKFPIFTGIYMHLCHSAALLWGLMNQIEKENRKLLSVTAIVYVLYVPVLFSTQVVLNVSCV